MLVKKITKHFMKFVDDVTLEVAKDAYKALETFLDERYEQEAKARMKDDKEAAMVFKRAMKAAKEAAQKVTATENVSEATEEETVPHHPV